MNIAMFGHKRIPSREGGIEIVVEELATRMVQRGHQVTCYSRSGHHVSGAVYDSNVTGNYKGVRIKPVWTVNFKGLAAVTSSISAAWQAARSNADIVHIHAEGPAVLCWLPKWFHKRVIVTIHGLDWKRAKWGNLGAAYIRHGERQAVRYADEIIVLSEGIRNYFRDAYNRETTFIKNGVTKPEIREAREIRSKWGLSKDSYVLFVGRIVPEKGLEYLIEAWKHIKTDKKLVIAGGSSDTRLYMHELKRKSKESVIFTGFQQGRVLEELYSNAYVYVQPSDIEGMPLSLLEAMSYGNCCLVSDIAECTEVVGDKAVIFPKGNVAELRNALQKLIDHPEMVRNYKNNISEYVINEYSWDDVVDKTLNLYARVK